MSKQDGGPAYPTIMYDNEVGELMRYTGMTLRDHFAGQALVGLLANPMGFSKSEDYSKHAYKHADAMLAARERQ